ncbi:MAG TPA: DUF2807 domain-containing protein [Bacteroidia bacterium]
MKTLIFTLAFGITAALGLAQTTQDRQVGDFTGIKVGSNIKVQLTQGDANSLKVEADEKDLPNVKTEVKDGNLEITGGGEGEVKVYLTVKMLNHIEVSGAASVKSQNQLTSDKMKIETSGAGSLKLDIKCSEIDANVSGASGLNLSGVCPRLTADVSGAATLKAFNLQSDNVTVSTAGASTAKVMANTSLHASSTGASSITYKGDPKEKSVEMSGVSSIHNADGNDEQTSNNPNDTMMKVHIGGNNVMICDDDDKDKHHHHHHNGHLNYWSGVEFGMDGYLDAQNQLSIPGNNDFLELNYAKSYDFNLNVFEHDFHLYRNNINLISGLGFEFNHYAFHNPVTLDPYTPYISAYSDSLIDYNKNNLNVSFVNVPLLLMFNTNNDHPGRGFYIGGGVIGGYKIHSVTKQEYSLDGYNYFVKKKADYYLDPFRLSATVRAGYGGFGLFATYALTTLFQNGKGPQLYPFTVGVSLTMD